MTVLLEYIDTSCTKYTVNVLLEYIDLQSHTFSQALPMILLTTYCAQNYNYMLA